MKIVRMNKVEYGKIIAFFDIETSEGLVIKGFKLIRMDEENIFVASPSKKDGSEEKYNDIVYMDKNLKYKLAQSAKIFYQNPQDNNQNSQENNQNEFR